MPPRPVRGRSRLGSASVAEHRRCGGSGCAKRGRGPAAELAQKVTREAGTLWREIAPLRQRMMRQRLGASRVRSLRSPLHRTWVAPLTRPARCRRSAFAGATRDVRARGQSVDGERDVVGTLEDRNARTEAVSSVQNAVRFVHRAGRRMAGDYVVAALARAAAGRRSERRRRGCRPQGSTAGTKSTRGPADSRRQGRSPTRTARSAVP